MAYNIHISDVAELDIKDAMFYYRTKASEKVAQNFLIDFETRLESLKINPYYRFYYGDLRGLSLKKFPYIIFFKIDENEKMITIYSVFETHQNTNKRP